MIQNCLVYGILILHQTNVSIDCFNNHALQIVNALQSQIAVLVRLTILWLLQIYVVSHQITAKSVILKPLKLARHAWMENI
jgi:hypothetical protein